MGLVVVGMLALLADAPPAQRERGSQQVLPPARPIVRPQVLFTMTGVASWYAATDPGVGPVTASGEPFDDTQWTCANWDLPFGSEVQVTNLETGRRVAVRVNDRGPARRLVAQGRVIDLSKAAFSQIASLEQGLVLVKVELLQPVRKSSPQ